MKGGIFLIRIDDLITEIKSDEAIEINGELSEIQKKRIKQKVMQTTCGRKRSARKNKKILAVLLVSVLTVAFALTAYASNQQEWDIMLTNYMGISDADTLQLEGGQVEINKTCESQCMDYSDSKSGEQKNVTMRAVNSIGDKNHVYIRIETDYEIPEDFNPETNYIYAKESEIIVSDANATTIESFVEDNKLGFFISIEGKNINRKDVCVRITDLYLGYKVKEDAVVLPEELICSGTWELNWKYNYKSNTKTYYRFCTFEDEGTTYYLSQIEVSPISIRAKAFRMPYDKEKNRSEDAWIKKIYLKDGTIIEVDSFYSSSAENGIFYEVFISVPQMSDSIVPEEIEKIVIGDKEVSIN